MRPAVADAKARAVVEPPVISPPLHAEHAATLGQGLTPLERRLLGFEQQWWLREREKERAVWSEFGLSSARYFQLVNRLLDDPRALQEEPSLVSRLRRVRERRRRARFRSRIGRPRPGC